MAGFSQKFPRFAQLRLLGWVLLTAAEERALENYLNVGRTLEFLKAKARLSLRGNTSG